MHKLEQHLITWRDAEGLPQARLVDRCTECNAEFHDAESGMNSICEYYIGPDPNIPSELPDRKIQQSISTVDFDPEIPTGIDNPRINDEYDTLDELYGEYPNLPDNRPLWNTDSWKDALWEGQVYLTAAKERTMRTKKDREEFITTLRKAKELAEAETLKLQARLEKAKQIYREQQAKIKQLEAMLEEKEKPVKVPTTLEYMRRAAQPKTKAAEAQPSLEFDDKK